MNTKLSQIEKSLKLKYRLESDGEQGRSDNGARRKTNMAGSLSFFENTGQPRNRENEELINELQRYNGVLLRENSDLKARVKVNMTPAVREKEPRILSTNPTTIAFASSSL